MRHFQKVPSGLPDSLLSFLETFLIHSAVTTCTEILYQLSGTLAVKEETAHDTGTEYSLGAVKSIGSLCIQFLPTHLNKMFAALLCVGEAATILLSKHSSWALSVNGFASLTAQ